MLLSSVQVGDVRLLLKPERDEGVKLMECGYLLYRELFPVMVEGAVYMSWGKSYGLDAGVGFY